MIQTRQIELKSTGALIFFLYPRKGRGLNILWSKRLCQSALLAYAASWQWE